MPDEKNDPGHGRATADAKFAALKKEIAQRNDVAQREGRAARAAREAEQVTRRRIRDRD
jgi:hypothetical protein